MISPYCIPVTLPQLEDSTISNLIIESLDYQKDNSAVNLQRTISKMIIDGDDADDKFPFSFTEGNRQITINRQMYDSIKDEFLQSIERTSVSPKTIYRIRGRSPEISKEFLIEIGFPKSIIDITDRISLQMSIGNGLLPHTDFGRRTSLFYLLTEHTDNWLTNWYQHNEEIKSLRDPNNYGFTWTWINQEHTRLTLKESVNIKHKQWYIFNNEAYHSVYSNEDYSKDQIRVSLCVECDATVEELYNILNECN